MSDPDPCCVHEHQLDAAIRDLARAHGRPEAAERIARGLPVTSQHHDKPRCHRTETPTKARPQQAGLTRTTEDA